MLSSSGCSGGIGRSGAAGNAAFRADRIPSAKAPEPPQLSTSRTPPASTYAFIAVTSAGAGVYAAVPVRWAICQAAGSGFRSFHANGLGSTSVPVLHSINRLNRVHAAGSGEALPSYWSSATFGTTGSGFTLFGGGTYGESSLNRRSLLPAAYTNRFTPSSNSALPAFSSRLCHARARSRGECTSSSREPLLTPLSFGGGLSLWSEEYTGWSAGRSSNLRPGNNFAASAATNWSN